MHTTHQNKTSVYGQNGTRTVPLRPIPALCTLWSDIGQSALFTMINLCLVYTGYRRSVTTAGINNAVCYYFISLRIDCDYIVLTVTIYIN